MRRSMTALFLMASLLSWVIPAPAYTLQYTNPSATPQIKWANTTITIAFSTSLNSPPPNIKAGSDVVGAARRALAHWSQNSNIRFIETTSEKLSISPGGSQGGDGVNLISVANTPENTAVFPACGSTLIKTGQTRVIYNPDTGAILESDIVINPCLQFSTDGTTGTYDLESTLTHELGHLLGLEHSGIIGATMQPQQGQNGLYNLPALTPRTLSEDDRAGIHALYGPGNGLGAIAGTLRADTPIFGAHVWAENTGTGQVIAGNITFPNGTFRIDGLPPGTYRVIAEPIDEPIKAREIASTIGPYGQLQSTQPLFRTIELSSQLSVTANTTTALNVIIANSGAPTINPRLFGIAGQLSTIPLPLTPGNTYKLYVGGEGLDRVFAQGVTVTSPYFSINPATFMQQDFGTGYPIITFDVTVAPSAPAGDYSLRFLATGNEIAYLSGALTVDYPEASATANPIDDAQFFVRQHYIDFLNREPDAGGLQYWTEQITGNSFNTPPRCPAGDRACESNRRVRVSAAYFIENEFQQTGYFVYRMYEASFNRQPTFNEFVADRAKVSGGNNTEAKKQAFADEWVQRPDFLNNYPATLSPEAFVDRLFSSAELFPYNTERAQLAADLRNGVKTRAQVVRAVIEVPEFVNREYNPAFVLMQYFGYLKRNPDPGGYQFWLDVVNNRVTNNYLAMVCAFITSTEYQQRFGPVITRSNSDCSTVGQ